MRSISQKISIVIFIVSLLLALLTSSIQLYQDYNADRAKIYASLDLIESSYLQPVVSSTFSFDRALLKSQLDGLQRLPGILCASLESSTEDAASFEGHSNCPSYPAEEIRRYPLAMEVQNRTFHLGTLVVHYSFGEDKQEYVKKIPRILVSNIAQTFLGALIMLLLIRILVTKPLAYLRDSIANSTIQKQDPQFISIIKRTDEIGLLSQVIRDHQDTITSLVHNLQIHNVELAQLLHVVSHDLRTPMVNISGYSQESTIILSDALNQNRSLTKDEINECSKNLTIVKNAADHFHNQMRGLGRYLRAMDVPLHIEVLHINELWKKACERTETLRSECRAIIDTHFSATELLGDRDALLMVITYVLENALLYSRPKEPPVISVKTSVENSRFQIIFDDQGIGIPLPEREKVLSLFYRGTATGTGIGMGLTISHKLIQRMNGSIQIQESLTGGTRVVIQLPVKSD